MSAVSVRVLCPAKVNLFLSVGPRDTRGYHPIRTVFQAVSLFDELTLERAGADSFSCDVDLPDRNTVTRAWSLLAEYRSLPPLRVFLKKHIPSQAGLGGGSSDAAGFIRGACVLAGIALEVHESRDLCAVVGADVPFFLLGGQAKGEGYGERLTPLPDPEHGWAVVVKPEAGCSTAEMYALLDGLERDWLGFPSVLTPYNDFERVAPAECLELVARLRRQGSHHAGLSGSGSAVYGLFKDKATVDSIVESLMYDGYRQAFAVKLLSKTESTVFLRA